MPSAAPIVLAYSVYLAAACAVTVWVARALCRGGRVFLLDAFHGHAELADSVNRLLVVGFYLVSLGFVTLALSTSAAVTNTRLAIEFVSGRLGQALLVLGCMHFANLYVLNRLRKRGREGQRTSPADRSWTPQGAPLGKVLD